MKIKVEKWITDEGDSYKILEMEKCCDKIINSEATSLNSEYDINDGYDNPEYSVKLVIKESDYDGYTDYSYETIKFCPFCGEEINIEIIKQVDKTEEYRTLQEQQDLIWDKCINTDSKKKEQELNQQIGELRKKMDDILRDDGF